MYLVRGQVPRKRHTQLWFGERLLTEEVVGVEGFSGASSILYHLRTPVRVRHIGEFRPIVRDEWIPDAHAHHLFDTRDVPPSGDALSGRRVLMWNQDVEIALCRPDEPMAGFYRNGEGDELIFVHEGEGTLATILGDLPYRAGDYVVIPRGITYRVVPHGDAPQRHLVFTSPGLIEIPRRYRNDYGQLLEHAPFHNRDLHGPTELRTHDEAGEFEVTLRIRDGYQRYVLDHHPFDVVGWDGYLYPYMLNIRDFEPIAKKVHAPPPVHQTFAGPGFVICSFCPRPLDWHEDAVPIPYNHANLNSEELIYYVDGSFSSRRDVDVGCLTLHPSGVPHGPQPGLAERSLGADFTDELAVMCDTFHPLRLTTHARELDRPGYAYSWYDEPPEASTVEGRPEGVPSVP
ncbi:MAG TPA: homogentisate 1,2-dioxygenase [Nitriliruptorales bacterium]|nr:homogentisate 1,2-dioxygenase [Nitriliruptorales bacterium]